MGLELGLDEALALGDGLGLLDGLGLELGVGGFVGTVVGVAGGVGEPPAPGGCTGNAGIPPLVLQAETAAHSATAASRVNSDSRIRPMAQEGYSWLIRASPARVECLKR